MNTPIVMWTITEDGWIISASGARLGRVTRDSLYLYDKRTRTNVEINMHELLQVMQSSPENPIPIPIL